MFWVLLAPICAAQIPRPDDAAKPLPPEASAAAYRLPEGFRLEVVAAEPLIAAPSGLCWDERGRLFVSELHGYNLEGQLDIEELNKTGKLDTQVRRVQADEKFKKAAEPGTYGVVKLLRDSDGDGRMDQADVWATNLPPAYGLVPARGGVIVACAPHILFLADHDGDGAAETREVLFTGFNTGALERGINAPQWGPDGWIYFGRGWAGGEITGPLLPKPVNLPNSDFRIRADGRAIEPVTGATHTFGFTFTETGDRFTVDTTRPGIFIAPLPWRYLERNPDAATPPIEIRSGGPRVYPLAPPHPWRRKRAEDAAYSKFYRDRYGASDSDASGWFTSACGPFVYRDDALPGLRGHYFVCDPSGNLIHRAIVDSEGAELKLRRAPGEETSEFAASGDPWSHPIALAHGPDGAIWVVDYYREIIEDYSAIPRHLQQQYGLYAGHDRGRIYRLTHRDARAAPSSDMAGLGAAALAHETASTLFWRRATAQRLLTERGDAAAVPALRALLAAQQSEPSGVITALRALDGLNALEPMDVEPFLRHADPAVRVHALQLADRWFARDEGRGLLDAALDAAGDERHARTLVQFALSLGETRDARGLSMLARFAREHSSVRWMDAAVLSSIHGHGADMIEELLALPVEESSFLTRVAQSVAASQDDAELSRVLRIVTEVPPALSAAILEALAKGRKNAPPKPLGDPAARRALASLAASGSIDVRAAARAFEATFVTTLFENDPAALSDAVPPVAEVSEETFRRFVAALQGPRDPNRGHEIFRQACATCHRVGDEGHVVGPDLLGELGVDEETLVRHLLLPNERIRPGFEMAVIETRAGQAVVGLITDDGATSLTLRLPGGVEHVLLRKDVTGVRRLATSLMPSFAESLAPSDMASLLAWLRSQLGTRD